MKRALKSISFILAALSITAVISVALLLEPTVKIYGYAELDDNRLSNIKNTLMIYSDDGKLSDVLFTPVSSLSRIR